MVHLPINYRTIIFSRFSFIDHDYNWYCNFSINKNKKDREKSELDG